MRALFERVTGRRRDRDLAGPGSAAWTRRASRRSRCSPVSRTSSAPHWLRSRPGSGLGGGALAAEGDFGHAVCAIESVTADGIAGDVAIRSIGPCDVVGENRVLLAGRRTASVVATSPPCVIGLCESDIWALERTAPEAARWRGVLLAEHRYLPPPRPSASTVTLRMLARVSSIARGVLTPKPLAGAS